MQTPSTGKARWQGILLALVTVIIWSGNYVVAKGISTQIPPVSIAFYRWSLATFCIFPLALKQLPQVLFLLKYHKRYLFFTALTGITIFNTLIYLAGHYTSAINLALIGTTAAPVFITVLSVIFLREKAGPYRVAGMAICLGGILFLLCGGDWHKLAVLHFGKGDLLMLISAFSFSVYSILVKKQPPGIPPAAFLFTVFACGTLMLLPFYLREISSSPAVQWQPHLLLTIVYLGIGNSVIGFFGWNVAIERLGASTTSLFANLIPVFSTLEAVIFLGEAFTIIHLLSGLIIVAGVLLANKKYGKQKSTTVSINRS